jgi:hypothetical protein
MRKAMARAAVCLVVLELSVPLCSVGQRIERGSVTVRVEEDKGRARAKLARQLAKKLPTLLPKLLQGFQARRRDLLEKGGGDAYPKDELAKLLDSTEASLKKQFKGDELAPVRDHVAVVFEKARADLGFAPRAACVTPPVQQILFASLQPFPQELAETREQVDRERADPWLDAVEALFGDLSRKSSDLTVDLCVVSAPRGAKVVLRSRSSKRGEKQKTIARFQNLFRGSYCYEVTGKGFNIPCADSPENQINLWDKRQPVLECEKSDQECFLRDSWPQTCRGR